MSQRENIKAGHLHGLVLIAIPQVSSFGIIIFDGYFQGLKVRLYHNSGDLQQFSSRSKFTDGFAAILIQ